MESDLSNLSSCEESERFLDAPDDFSYDCFSSHSDSDRRMLASGRKPNHSVLEMHPSSSYTELSSFKKQSTIEINGELSEVIDACEDSAESGRYRFDPIHTGSNRMIGEKFEKSRATTTLNEDYAESRPTSTNWSLLRLVIRSIKFQVTLMISFIKFPPWLISSCLTFVLDPYRTTRRGKRYLLSWIVELCNLGLKDHNFKVVRKLAWGLFGAVYIGIVLLVLLFSALMVSGFVMTHLAHEPLVIKESLNFDYTKNSPEAYVPITSCDGIGFDSSCKDRVSKVRPSNQRTKISVSMTLPDSEYNRNLGMFQIRLDFLSASGQTIATSRRPCIVRFRTEPIRLFQTFLKIAPLVTGYVSEIQTLNLKLKDFVEKEIIPTASLKIVIEQRAEFRPGAGIPEIYDASLLLESELPFFKRMIWNWRRTLFVWISMGLLTMKLLFALVFCRPLINPITNRRTQQRDRILSINNNLNLHGQMRR